MGPRPAITRSPAVFFCHRPPAARGFGLSSLGAGSPCDHELPAALRARAGWLVDAAVPLGGDRLVVDARDWTRPPRPSRRRLGAFVRAGRQATASVHQAVGVARLAAPFRPRASDQRRTERRSRHRHVRARRARLRTTHALSGVAPRPRATHRSLLVASRAGRAGAWTHVGGRVHACARWRDVMIAADGIFIIILLGACAAAIAWMSISSHKADARRKAEADSTRASTPPADDATRHA